MKMIMITGPLPRDEEGKLLERTKDGHPTVYVIRESQMICPTCAQQLEESWGIPPIGWNVNTNRGLQCFSCEGEIPYVEPGMSNDDRSKERGNEGYLRLVRVLPAHQIIYKRESCPMC